MIIQRPKYTSKILIDLPNKETVLFVVGGRQVGKTTILRSLITEGHLPTEQTYELSGDHIIDLNLQNGESMLRHIAKFREISKIKYLIIDEVQYIQNIGLILKNLVDMVRAGQLDMKIIVCGSSSLNIFKGLTDTLTGRKTIVPIYSFDFQEFLSTKNINLVKDYENSSFYETYMEEYLSFGGYPQVVLADSVEHKKQLFVQLFRDYIFKDIMFQLSDKDVVGFRAFLQVIASKVGATCTLETLCQETKIARHNLEKYMFVIQNTFLLQDVSNFVGNNISGENKKLHKRYFNDIGMLRFLMGFGEIVGDYKAKLIENMIYRKILDSKQTYQNIYMRNTRNNAEVDFVIQDEFDQKLIAVEVKNSDATKIPKSLQSFCSGYGGAVQGAFVITDSIYSKKLSDSIDVSFVPSMYFDLVQK